VKIRCSNAIMFLCWLGNTGHDRDENSTWLQEMKRPLLRISSNRINDNVKSNHRLLESLLFIVQSLFSTQALDVVQIGKPGARDYVKTSLAGQLHGVRANVSCGPKDEDRLPGS